MIIHNIDNSPINPINVIKLGNLSIIAFKLMKIIPANYMVRKYIREYGPGRDSTIIEISSSTMAIAMAYASNMNNLKCIIVADDSINPSVKNIVTSLGGKVEIVRHKDISDDDNISAARIRRVNEIVSSNESVYFTSQHQNFDNRDAYRKVASEVFPFIKEIDILIGTVGTGGSLSGIGYEFKMRNQDLRIIAVDQYNSVIFGLRDGKRVMRGMGGSVIPKNVDFSIIDEVHWVPLNETIIQIREMFKKYGFLGGVSTGAACLVAQWYAKKFPDKNVVLISPDEGERYTDSLFTDMDAVAVSDAMHAIYRGPILVNDPSLVKPNTWSYRSFDSAR